MSNLRASSRRLSSGLFALLALGAAASATAACAKADEEKKQATWTCTRDEVPMGEVVRCSTSALTADGPTAGATSGGTTGTTADGTLPDPSAPPPTTYSCSGEFVAVDCPPIGVTGGDGTDPVGTASGSTGSSSQEKGPDECSFVPDLDYCGGTGGGSVETSGGTTSGSTSSGGTDCAKQNCDVPGQQKKNGTTTDGTTSSSSSSSGSSGASSSGSSSGSSGSSGGSGGGGKSWTCTKDDQGSKTCVSTPDCAPGTHAAACGACVDDSDASSDCVPPTEGGCWITGGGFIEGASLVPAAPSDGKDNFGGNAKPMKKGGVSGHWNHVDHGTGNHAKGRPEYIMCRVTDGPGPKQPGGKKGLTANQVYFGGHAQWRTAADATWSDGYWFDVVAEDHGEPGNTSAIKNGAMPDSYHFTIRKMDDPAAKVSGAVVYETRDDLRGGNIQIHPSNAGHPAVSSPLPTWVSLEP
ncbi:MAG: hypothetical protein JWO86_6509 [Myxococcaceae bacterium]|nr:hypothetical protein [Myxococcaceae bacterium]MEA2748987.1 hypothetical protein [Myxococcales bacterium]